MSGNRVQIQSAATATGDGLTFGVRGFATTSFQVTGTFVGTITFEATIDGNNWVSLQVVNVTDGSVSTTATAAGVYTASTASLGSVRARISGYTSGSITVVARGVTEGSGMSLADIDISGAEDVTVTDIEGFDTVKGQTTMAESLPVVLPSDQSDVPVTLDSEQVDISDRAARDLGQVDIAAALPAGEAHLGEVGAKTYIKDVTCSLDAGVAYADGDVLFDTQEVTSSFRVNDGTGVILSVRVIDKDDQGENFDLYFLNASSSIGTENSAVSVSDANADNILGYVAVDSYYDLGGCQICVVRNIGLGAQAVSGGTSLYVAGVSRGTGTYTASGITLRITILAD